VPNRIKRRGEKYNRSYETTGAALYLRLELERNGHIWSTAALANAADTTLANSAIAMTEFNRTWSVAIPATLPCGTYIASVFVKAGADPSTDDEKISPEFIDILPEPGE